MVALSLLALGPRSEVQVVLEGDTDGAAGRRIAAEAASAGIRVLRAPAESDATVTVHEGGVELSLQGRTRRITNDDPALLALETVEQLLAYFVPVDGTAAAAAAAAPAAAAASAAAAAPPAAPPAADAVRRDAPPDRAPISLAVDLGVTGIAAQGGLDPALGVQAGLHLQGRRFGGGALVVIGLEPAELRQGGAEGDVATTLVGLHGDLALLERDALFVPEVGALAGLVVVSATGEVAPPRVGRDETLLAGCLMVHGGGALHLVGPLHLRLMAAAGALAPRPTLRFEGRDVAHLGRFFGFGGLTLETNLTGLLASEAEGPQ